ncbi:MAG: heme NO-binding domain-containing protein [Planctomycetales bacterium]|nr:heme NO-binding domain-containing protein [Planctomycetales bacterium]
MKGVIFTEFAEMVEQSWSPELWDDVLDSLRLDSDGAYTAVGNYDYRELAAIVEELSHRTGVDRDGLHFQFGKHLLRRFADKFPEFFDHPDAFSFLETVDGRIHVEVLKLYPDAAPPDIATTRVDADTLLLGYESKRSLADFAHGMIQAAVEHFGGGVEVVRRPTPHGATFTLHQCTGAPA